MGKPAARMGDMTVHGGSIVVGAPTVMIGGKMAARVGDMHTCPMQTPAAPSPIPHVGGPILPPGVPTVLIAGVPAACVGDMVTCVGAPDTIAPPGCPTVLIGAGGGGGGGAGVGAAGEAALAAAPGSEAAEAGEEHFLEVNFVDNGGRPIVGGQYSIRDPDGNENNGLLVGRVRNVGVVEGDHEISLSAITKCIWAENNARDGDRVQMQVEAVGVADGVTAVFQVWQRDIKRADQPIAYMENVEVRDGKAEAEWAYEYSQDVEEETQRPGYSYPRFYFTVRIGEMVSRSGVLDYKDWIELEMVDENGEPLADELYEIRFSTGEVRQGRLDSDGRARIEGIPTASHQVFFPSSGDVLSEGAE